MESATTSHNQDSKFCVLKPGRKIWAVGAVHGEATKISAIHNTLSEHFRAGDQLIYLGNILGRGPDVAGALHEILAFRRLVILQDGAEVDDVIFLRGAQEEMLYKLRHIPFAQEPEEVLEWMGNHGIEGTLKAYGTSLNEGISSAQKGMTELSQWMNMLKVTMRKMDGHDQYLSALKRAAYTEDKSLLFVNANIVPDKPLDAQGDAFWWGTYDFRELDHPFQGFERVVRGYDHRQLGYYKTKPHVCLDGGAGMGGKLICAAFDPSGAMLERFEV